MSSIGLMISNVPSETIDATSLELTYLSEAKVEHLNQTRGLIAAGITVMGNGGQLEREPGKARHKLGRVAKMLKKQGKLSRDTPNPEQFFLTRAIMASGIAWPWAKADDSSGRHTAWWVGSSDAHRIFAYGHRDHLVGQGKIPVGSDAGTTVWWPSMASGFAHLLKEIELTVEEGARRSSTDLSSADERIHEVVARLEALCFSSHGDRLEQVAEGRGVFEILMRVDKVIERGETQTVLGSPIYVARTRDSVPGVYEIPDLAEDGFTWVGDWNGFQWRGFEKRPAGTGGRGAHEGGREATKIGVSSLAALPGKPDVEEIISLGELELLEWCLRCERTNAVRKLTGQTPTGCEEHALTT